MFKIAAKKLSSDGSIKYVLASENDNCAVEAIYFMREISGQPSEGTICLSSQAGCNLNCAFCETGHQGFKRNLTAEELSQEVQLVEADLGQDISSQITSYALMGMGEPLLNYDNIKTFYQHNITKENIHLISLATSGICEKIDLMAAEKGIDFDLFLSLHSPFEQQRIQLMPIAKNYTIERCLASCRNYAEAKNQKVKINYLLLDGVNTSEEHVAELIKIIDKDLFVVQILLYNQGKEKLFVRPSLETAESFQRKLNAASITTNLVISKGRDVGGGCGQMAGELE